MFEIQRTRMHSFNVVIDGEDHPLSFPRKFCADRTEEIIKKVYAKGVEDGKKANDIKASLLDNIHSRTSTS